LADEANTRLCDVAFRYDPNAANPNCLHFKVLGEVRYENSRLFAYGSGKGRANDMQAVYRETIVERGGIRARIEMSGGKARLLIRYRKGDRIPPDQP
jgi:hypothetical protein